MCEQFFEPPRLRRAQIVEDRAFVAHVFGERPVDQVAAGIGQCDHPRPAVSGRRAAGDQAAAFQPIDAFGHRAGGHHREGGQLAGRPFVRRPGAAKRGQHIEFALAQAVSPINQTEPLGQQRAQPVQPPDHALRTNIQVGPLSPPFGLNAGDMVQAGTGTLVGILVGILTHRTMIASSEGNIVSMEANSDAATFRWALVTAIAPIAWGTNYFVTAEFLPADHPLYGAAIRALPAGLLLLAVRRRLPSGSWWWRSAILGVLNVGAFFTLVYVSAQLLPTSVASTIMATSPVALMLIAWALIAERPRVLPAVGAVVGIAGVGLLLLTGAAAVNPLGVVASVAAMTMSSVGYVLAKRWSGDVDVLASTSWQLVAGGLALIPVAIAVEGPPPVLDGAAVLGFAYVSVVATALAFVCWFAGLKHLRAGTVGLVGLLNPATGVLLGTAIAGETLTGRQWTGLTLVVVGIGLGQPLAARILVRRPRRIRACGWRFPRGRAKPGRRNQRSSDIRARPANGAPPECRRPSSSTRR